ncbi:protein NEN1-like [Neltuma alba]|uniref:protein NEN1-like n=1 Tax=Neltuma alba TaxID=207710 RepID=UPI0010A36D75|nr:protein NEN1-like [Prosopis alba]
MRRNVFTSYIICNRLNLKTFFEPIIDFIEIERIWVGHNILKFDCVRVRDAFTEINRPPLKPKATIDSLDLLTKMFRRRAGDMKLATLARCFGLGPQTHRSLDDVRMTLDVLKHCAAVLFLESSLPEIFTANSWLSPNATTRSRSNGKSLSPVENSPASPIVMCSLEGSESSSVDANGAQQRHFDLRGLWDELNRESIQPVVVVDEMPTSETPQMSSSTAVSDACSSSSIAFGVNEKYKDRAGQPKLNFLAILDPSQSLCKVLEACDSTARGLSLESGSSSDWRPIVTRKEGFFHYAVVRLHIPTVICEKVATYATVICQKESSGTVRRLLFSKVDVEELGSVLKVGTFVDAVCSLDPYDYKQHAGIRLITKKLTINCK